MAEPSEKYKDFDFLVSRIGMPAVILGVMFWFHFHEFSVFRREINWKTERMIRNERAIMQKMGIPMIMDSDLKEK